MTARIVRGGITRAHVDTELQRRRVLTAALLLAVGAVWALPLRGSLWMDELGTWWVIEDGLRQTISRAQHIQGQTPLYYVLEWVVRHVFGRSELALRIPSFIAMAVAAYLFYRLTTRLLGETTARIATLAFALSPMVILFANDARPYAIATMVAIASTLALVRWIDRSRPVDGVVYVVLAALTIYTHYIFSLVFIGHAAYAMSRKERVRARGIVAAVAGTAILVAPAVPQLLDLFSRRHALSVSPTSASLTLFQTLVPPVFIGGALAGLLLFRLFRPVALGGTTATAAAIALGAGWLIGPPLVLYLISTVSPVSIFANRYLISAAPGFAILAGAALAHVQPTRARTVAMAGALACTVWVYGATTHTTETRTHEGWREALRQVSVLSDGPSTPVLLHGAFIEAKQLDWLTDPFKSSYLNAPAQYYPVTGHLIAMPYAFNKGLPYVQGLLPMLRSSTHFFYVTRYAFVPTPQFLAGALRPDGFTMKEIGTWGVVDVFEFRRR